MLYLTLNQVKPEMVLAQDIISENNMVLLRKDTTLTDKHISFIEKYNYKGLYINDSNFKEINIKEIISEELKNKTIKNLKEFNIDELLLNSKEIVDEVINKPNITFDLIENTNQKNLYNHSLDVALKSLVIGIDINLTYNNLIDLTIASLLHDYGKMCVDNNLRNSLKKYNDYSKRYNNFRNYEERLYPLYSFLLIKDDDKLNSTIKNIVLAHNIDMDTDYEIKKNDKISIVKHNIFGDIIHVTDTYDSISINYHNRYKLINNLKENYSKVLHPKYLDILLKHIPIYPIGSVVKLSDGRWGVVKENNLLDFNNPIVKTFDGRTINLAKRDIEIINDKIHT